MNVELNQNETVEKEVQGDYWSVRLKVLTGSQVRGNYAFTNERIIFKGGFGKEVEIFYNQIESIVKCNVGCFIPTGIKVTMKDGKTHVLSVLKRESIMELIQSKLS